jgi:hypothetical protein
MSRRIRVTSSALGFPATVTVWVYPDLDALSRATSRFNGNWYAGTDTRAVTQLLTWTRDDGTVDPHPIVRLIEGHLGTEVLVHEMHHATLAIYGATLKPNARAGAHLTHYNEPLAYLHGELVRRLVDRLYAHGYYTPGVTDGS